MNILYLAIQHTYTEVQAGLYRDNHCLETISIHKHLASSLLVEKIKKLLAKHTINLNAISFIAVNQGPGPFTTLRVVIATVNGISFALGIPLVGVDGIKALLGEYHNTHCSTHIALLNAFNQDVYFALKDSHNQIYSGYDNIDVLLKHIDSTYGNTSLCFFGNGASIHADIIKKIIPDGHIAQNIEHCSLAAIARNGLAKWQHEQCVSTQLQPLYLKNAFYKTPSIAK